jgi:hypothetical protein
MSRSHNWSRVGWLTVTFTSLVLPTLTTRANAQLDPLALLTCPASLNQCNNNETKCTNSLSTCLSTLSTCQNSLASAQKGPAGTPGETRLLFPFVTNQSGFDTGISIANTSMDPFGTTAEEGTCTLTFYGNGVPSTNPATTTTVAAGMSYVTLASTVAPGFQGYMIADCSFDFAHGFAFVSEIGARSEAMGYLPLVINDKTRTPTEGLDE